jgi:hypothetical protein
MDSTLLSIFIVLAIFIGWVGYYAFKMNSKSKSEKKSTGIKDELFGKKRRSKKGNRGEYWALE